MNKHLYLVRVTRHYYAGTIHSGRVQYYGRHLAEHGMDPHAPIVGFPDRAAAKAAIEALDESVYRLGNGEYARPTLREVPVSAAPDHVRHRVVSDEFAEAGP